MAKTTKQESAQATTATAKNRMAGKATAELFRVSKLAEGGKVPAWELAALRKATGWAPGKQVTEAQFAEALIKLRNRPQGGGRI